MNEAADYPFRRVTVATHNPGAPWTVVFSDEAGELDANIICRLQDALEAGSSILLAARTQAALDCVAAVLDRLLAETPDRVLH